MFSKSAEGFQLPLAHGGEILWQSTNFQNFSSFSSAHKRISASLYLFYLQHFLSNFLTDFLGKLIESLQMAII